MYKCQPNKVKWLRRDINNLLKSLYKKMRYQEIFNWFFRWEISFYDLNYF